MPHLRLGYHELDTLVTKICFQQFIVNLIVGLDFGLSKISQNLVLKVDVVRVR